MAHFNRQAGQSVERFRLIGGVHFRNAGRGEDGRVKQVRVNRGDTLHLTQKEFEAFRDKFEVVVESPAQATFTVPEADAPTTDSAPIDHAGDSSDSPDDPDDGTDEVPAVSAGDLGRPDFSSDQAFEFWQGHGEFDLSRAGRTGHNGTTYSKSDVEGAYAALQSSE